ncbi:MAG TPA: M23 family metallopeptidase [Terriglobales bacterium]|jgi:murein DD-endopeptidase|nr:M23 family metallopeptidase [Terriglobales bacterium]
MTPIHNLRIGLIANIADKVLRLPPATALRFAFAFLIILGTLQPGFARERGPRVEVVCPSQPIPVRQGEQQVLVYELHITNFDLVPMTLKHLEIFAAEDNSQPLKVFSDDALSATMVQTGSIGGAKDSRTIDPGSRAVVFLWIGLRLDQPVPSSLRQRLVFVAGGTGNTTAESVLEDFPVLVSHDAVPLLSPPFAGGVWLAGDFGNGSGHRRSFMAIDGHVHEPERFAIDWVKVGPNGDTHHDGTTRNENWWGFGEPILAVADGEVTQVVDGIAENTPRVLPRTVTLDNIAGNYLILRIASNRYATYAHLQTGSIKVRPHDHVRRGDVLARLGNTGNATGAHLHFQVTDGNSVLQSEGVPFIFDHFTYLGPGSEYEIDKHPSTPWTHSIPGDEGVIEFTSANK